MREENQSSKLAKMKANLQKQMKKRWVLPAVYLGLAALVLSTVIWLQGSDEQIAKDDPNVEQGTTDPGVDANYEDALPVTTVNEVFKKPVVNEEEVKVIGHYFDFNSTEEQQQAALVFYDNTYFQNKGIDYAMESGETFDVVAALSGTVVKAEKDALFGNLIHIEHDNHVVTVYQSLEGLKVEEGQSVKQGEVIGRAGRNLFNQDAGIHVHFEIRQNGVPVNPADFFNQPVTALPSADAEKNEEEADELEDPSDEEIEKDDVENEEVQS
ncbi:peptidoglycan DD-metalloendopeptidase family protein [Anaerobacillus isosaccharinicus]|uniref:M23 family metallopeptidase n=1 Tax=Anaerobacillus isosaccharinicus TaxID=1532552 RepID=A0A1S2M6B4_9BACI|nr:M23 family metallopeptidase [Anaerobacillus isosaccharinicus]MBA5584388.1 M23 family metallopeptidase [Anaerobacillus isosaccharinicus]QOY37219.1 M23 family metallopeptidase [Anaerobacillus isosaccharinicus]